MLMRSQEINDLPSIDTKLLSTQFKDEIKLAKLFKDSANIKELLNGLKKELRGYFDAEALTIYFADIKNKQIVSKVKAGRLRKEIRLPIDKKSIAGFVAATGSVVNIVDAYDNSEIKSIDPQLKFDRSLDDKTKFTTKQILAAPIYCKKQLFGVIKWRY
jgi:transcriptional regulator with GAF, ATPase, and Fis domain